MMEVDFTGSVIRGTHRVDDLISAFTGVLEVYDPEEATRLRRIYADVYAAIEDARARAGGFYPSSGAEILAVDCLLEALFPALESLAPPGHYFGVHPGDGSDFGFWKCNP